MIFFLKSCIFKEATDVKVFSLIRDHGLIRFNKDGFGSVIEDPNRCLYLPAELKKFDGIESEWPVFFAFLLIDAKFKNNDCAAERFRKR